MKLLKQIAFLPLAVAICGLTILFGLGYFAFGFAGRALSNWVMK